MKNYLSVKDLGDIQKAVESALKIKKNPLKHAQLGKGKTMVLLFFNPSLRTRLSTQIAAQNLGMNVIVMDINKEGWKLETENGVVMDGDKPEHIKEAVPVIGRYADIIGVRAFAGLTDREADYQERIINQFVDYAGVPIVSLESAIRHPLQSYADIMTIEEYKTTERPKVVLTWAPHPKALPQAVANSFAECMSLADVDFVITHPAGYELDEQFTNGVAIEYNQRKAFEGADFIYAKNWSAYHDYGKIHSQDRDWTVDTQKMALTNNAKFMHCLPVRRNMIVTDEVIESDNSIVIDQAENRIYSAQAVIKKMLKKL